MMRDCSSRSSGYETTTCGIATQSQCTSLVSGKVHVHMLPAFFTFVGEAVSSTYRRLSANRFKDPIIFCSKKVGTPMASPPRALLQGFVIHTERLMYA